MKNLPNASMQSVLKLVMWGVFCFPAAIVAQNGEGEPTYLFQNANLRVSGAGGLLIDIGPVADQSSGFVGGGGGVLFNDQVLVGIFGMGMANEGIESFFPVNNTERLAFLSFGYGGAMVTYSPWANRVVHPIVSGRAGWGWASWELDTDENFDPSEEVLYEDNVTILHLEAGAEVNLLPWMKLQVLGGYRYADGLELPRISSSDLRGAYGGLRVMFGGWSKGNQQGS